MLVIILIVFSSPGLTQTVFCERRDNFLKGLATKYQEVPIARGIAVPGRLIEVLASETGSWTILMTHPNGIACTVAIGQGWEIVRRKLGREISSAR